MLLFFVVGVAWADGPGYGISKSTYAASDPFAGQAFLLKYFPVAIATDDCSFGDCTCYSDEGAWSIEQGRVYIDQGETDGFGMHLVNLSKRLTTGGLGIEEAEALFGENFHNQSLSYIDFNIGIYAPNLTTYTSKFDADGVEYHLYSWDDWYSCVLRVPTTMMIIELFSTELTPNRNPLPLQRMGASKTTEVLEMYESLNAEYVAAVRVSRSTSDMDAIDTFYKTVFSVDPIIDSSTRHCFKLDDDATVDLCFNLHQDIAGFAAGINAVHAELLRDQPLCGLDKWLDCHTSIDSSSLTTTLGDAVVAAIEASDYDYYCMYDSYAREEALHYVIDPTGWGVQINFLMSTAPSKCTDATLLKSNFNPACDLGTCASAEASTS